MKDFEMYQKVLEKWNGLVIESKELNFALFQAKFTLARTTDPKLREEIEDNIKNIRYKQIELQEEVERINDIADMIKINYVGV